MAEYSRSELSNKSNTWLLNKRASGARLDQHSHKIIEEIMGERGMTIPPIPKQPIPSRLPTRRAWIAGITIVAVMLSASAGGVLAKTYGLKYVILLMLIGGVVWVFMLNHTKTGNEIPKESGLDKIGEGGFTELMFSAGNGDIQRITDLLNYGYDINVKDRHGMTALMYAAGNGQAAVVDFLKKHGADVSLPPRSGKTASDLAAIRGFNELTKKI